MEETANFRFPVLSLWIFFLFPAFLRDTSSASSKKTSHPVKRQLSLPSSKKTIIRPIQVYIFIAYQMNKPSSKQQKIKVLASEAAEAAEAATETATEPATEPTAKVIDSPHFFSFFEGSNEESFFNFHKREFEISIQRFRSRVLRSCRGQRPDILQGPVFLFLAAGGTP